MKQLFVYQDGNAFHLYSGRERNGETFIRTVEAPADHASDARKWFTKHIREHDQHTKIGKGGKLTWLAE